MSLLNTYRFISRHPLTRDHKAKALGRWLGWQVGSRLSSHATAVPFVDSMRLLVHSGMTGATGNIYCGLHDYEDMTFVMHFLRAGDLFADVGANVGTYTVLAATAGARVVSFEPVPRTFNSLLDNIHLNRLLPQVDARNQALGKNARTITMVADQDTTNRVLMADRRYAGRTVEVSQDTLDAALRGMGTPSLIKIDVEGFETNVIAGAQATLSSEGVQAVLMELNGSGRHYGFSDDDLHESMQALGFTSCSYHPGERRLMSLHGHRRTEGNTIYVRSVQAAQARVASSRRYRVLNCDV